MYKIIPSVLLLLPLSLFAYDEANGKNLFDKQDCVSCHAVTKFYPRENKIKNYIDLFERVEMCAYGRDTSWDEDEIMDVTTYLNKNFYKFKVQKIEED